MMAVRVVAIDGHGGAGKTTLAARLATALDNAPVVHTDDFASWDDPLDWWPRLISQVLQPLSEGRSACYQRYDWVTRRLADWVDLPSASYLVLEGVSASRLSFRPYVTFAIWVDARRETCLARGLERDGEGMHQQWLEWMAAEDRYVASEYPDRRADLVVSGESIGAYTDSDDVAVLREQPS
jgi:uridine kinase